MNNKRKNLPKETKQNKKSANNERQTFNDEKKKYLRGDDFALIEGYKTARTNLIFSIAANEKNTVAFTSWSKGDGKSTATANVAIAFSELGKKVLLIDADMRRPNIHNLFEIVNDTGLSNVLAKFSDVSLVIRKDVITNLDIITGGDVPPNPSELLGSSQFKRIIEEYKDSYDYIFIDTPPVGVVADALMLKDNIAGFVVVVRERATTHRDLEQLLQRMEVAESNVLGFLKVGCKPNDNKRGKYGKRDYYSYQS